MSIVEFLLAASLGFQLGWLGCMLFAVYVGGKREAK